MFQACLQPRSAFGSQSHYFTFKGASYLVTPKSNTVAEQPSRHLNTKPCFLFICANHMESRVHVKPRIRPEQYNMSKYIQTNMRGPAKVCVLDMAVDDRCWKTKMLQGKAQHTAVQELMEVKWMKIA